MQIGRHLEQYVDCRMLNEHLLLILELLSCLVYLLPVAAPDEISAGQSTAHTLLEAPRETRKKLV